MDNPIIFRAMQVKVGLSPPSTTVIVAEMTLQSPALGDPGKLLIPGHYSHVGRFGHWTTKRAGFFSSSYIISVPVVDMKKVFNLLGVDALPGR